MVFLIVVVIFINMNLTGIPISQGYKSLLVIDSGNTITDGLGNIIISLNLSSSNSLSSSYAKTASFALNGGNGGTNLTTASTYQVTSSWSNKTVSSSYAATCSVFIFSNVTQSVTSSSFASASVSSSYATTASFALNGGGNGLITASTYQITSSNSVSASWAPSIFNGTSLTSSTIAVNTVVSAGSGINFNNQAVFNQGLTMVGQSIEGVGTIETTNPDMTFRINQGNGGFGGDCGVHVSNDSTSSLNSGASYYINVISSSGQLLSINSVQWTHVPPNRISALLPGWTYIVLNKDTTNVKGFGMCSPGISGLDSGNFSMFLCDIVNNLYRVPYWVSGVYQPGDFSYNLSVHGVTNAPLSGDIYTSGSIVLNVNGRNVSGSAGAAGGTINIFSGSLPAPSGIITRASGSADTQISYSLITPLFWRDSFTVSPANGTVSISGSLIAPSITGSLQGTSSNAISASWAPSSAGGTVLNTGSTYQITASNAISASWAPLGTNGTTLITASTYQITSSNSVSASWAPSIFNGTSLTSSTIAVNNIVSAGSGINFNNEAQFNQGLNMVGQSIEGVGTIETTTPDITFRINQGHGGLGGDSGVHVSNDSSSSLNSGASYYINVHSSSGAIISTNSVQWAHSPSNRISALLPGWTYIVLNKDAVNVKGFGMCSPGISGLDSGNFSMFLCDIVNNLYRVPFWVPGIYQPGDFSYNLSVHNVTNGPFSGDIYTSGSITLNVNSNNISGSAGAAGGTINIFSGSLPAPSGIITKSTGGGDTQISYSLITPLFWRDSFTVSPKTGNISCYGNTSFYGQMTITSSNGQYNLLTNGSKIDGNQIYTGSSIISNNFIALSPQGSSIAYDITNGGGTGMGRHFGNGCSIFDQTTEIVFFKNSSNFTDGIHNVVALNGTPTSLVWSTDGGGDIGISGSFRPQNIWLKGNLVLQGATSAITSSAINNNGFLIPIVQAGSSSLASATTTNILFSSTMPNTKYGVSLTGNGAALSNFFFSGKTTTGFTASFSSFTGELDWVVVSYTQ